MRKPFSIISLLLVISFVGANINLRIANAAPLSAGTSQYYDIGSPVLTNLYVSPTGHDENDGRSLETPFQTLGAAWRSIPTGTLTGSGYQVNLLPGSYPCEGDCINYFDDRHGTYNYPIILKAANASGTVRILGGLNLANVDYLYLMDMDLLGGGDYPRFANNILHCEACRHFLMKNVTVRGPIPDSNYDIQEVIKFNQSQYVYIEDSDASGSYQNILDFFSVQYGHVINSRFHHSGDWCGYIKGGSAYLLFDGNEFDHCRLGFSAGEGSNLEVMVNPWIHYEAYDIKFVNNVLHDVVGLGLRAAGGYNILFAYNTLYKVATDTEIGYSLLHMTFGARGCEDTSENGVGNGLTICNQKLSSGGWGPNRLTESQEIIPNKNVFVYNNIFYNPDQINNYDGQYLIVGQQTPSANFRNVPSPSTVDNNLVIKGNIIWNKPDDRELGAGGDGQGCQAGNVSCNAAQLVADNAINTLEPALVDPANGDFRPSDSSAVFSATVHSIPDFTWADAPASPAVPSGTLSNLVPSDRDGVARVEVGPPGAYSGTVSSVPVARLVSPHGLITSTRPVLTWDGVSSATAYQVRIYNPSGETLASVSPEEAGCAEAVSDCTFTPESGLTGGSHSWQIQTTSPEGARWSAAMDFNIYLPSPPVLNSIKPARANVYSKKIWVTIKGTNFAKNSVIYWGDTPLHTHRQSSTRAMGLVTADLLLTSGTSSLTIHNPDALIDGGVPSGGINFSVENPKPSISRVSPKVVLAGSTDTIIHVYGNNFVSGAAVNWNGAALATSFISRKQVDAVIPSAQLTTQLKAAITVTNPVPGGGTSKKMWLIIR